jgi:hypothetical protein
MPPATLNLFHPSDPCAHRIEPLLDHRFAAVPPEEIPHHRRKFTGIETLERARRTVRDPFFFFDDVMRLVADKHICLFLYLFSPSRRTVRGYSCRRRGLGALIPGLDRVNGGGRRRVRGTRLIDRLIGSNFY